MTRQELLAGLRRMGFITAAAFGVTILLSCAIGLLGGIPLRRAISVGFYLAAVVLLLLGLFQAVKPPVRPINESEGPPSPMEGMFGSRGKGPVRWATPEETGDAGATAGFLLGLGAVMLVVGTVVDGRRSLV